MQRPRNRKPVQLEKQKEGGEWQKRGENSSNKHILSNATERVRTKGGQLGKLTHQVQRLF